MQVFFSSLPFVIFVVGFALFIVWRKYRKNSDNKKEVLSLDDFPEEPVSQEYAGFVPAEPWNSVEESETSYFGRYAGGYFPIDQTGSDDEFSLDSFTEDTVIWDRQSLEGMNGNLDQTAEDPEMGDKTQSECVSGTGIQIPLEHDEANQQDKTTGDTMSEDKAENTHAGLFVTGKVRELEAAFEKHALKRD